MPDHEPALTLHECIYTLRAMRKLKTDPVPREDLEYIVDVATMACSPGNAQLWSFVVVTDQEQKNKIGALYGEVGQAIIKDMMIDGGTLDKEMEKVYRNAMVLVEEMKDAPALIFCCATGNTGDDKLSQSTFYGGIYPAIQNLMLAARSKGLGTTMTTIHKAREEDFKKIVGIPDEVETVALIPVGYPKGKWGKPKRKPSAEVTHWQHWNG